MAGKRVRALTTTKNTNLPATDVATEASTALARWNEQAQGAFADATRSAYQADLRIFEAWCHSEGREPFPAAAETVAAFLRAESVGGWVNPVTGKEEPAKSVATVKRRSAAIAKKHKAAKLANPCASEPVRLAIRAKVRAAKLAKIEPKQAKGLSMSHANFIARTVAPGLVEDEDDQERPEAECSALPQPVRLKDLRDLAIVLCGRDLMARASELIGLTFDDVKFDEEDGTAAVRLLRIKTMEIQDCMLEADAATVLRAWLDAAGITAGPLFVPVKKGGRVIHGKPLHRRDVSPALQGLAKQANIKGRFTAHSLRVGMAQDLVAANIGTAAIMQAGNWKGTAMLARYTSKLSAKRNAVAQFHAARKHK
jgi:integrase